MAQVQTTGRRWSEPADKLRFRSASTILGHWSALIPLRVLANSEPSPNGPSL